MITPNAPLPNAIDIIISNNIWGMDANKSIAQETASSNHLFALARNAKIVAIMLEITDAPIPMTILKLKPFIVRVNMSLPIQSVPNG